MSSTKKPATKTPAKKNAATKTPAKKTSATKSAAALTRWLGCFTATDPENIDSTFQMLCDAPSIDEAIDRFQARLRDLHKTTTLFHQGAEVFLEYVIDTSGDYTRPVLVNFVAQGSPTTSPVIFCDVPEQPDVKVDTYGPAEDEEHHEPLVVFKPKTSNATRRAKRVVRASAMH